MSKTYCAKCPTVSYSELQRQHEAMRKYLRMQDTFKSTVDYFVSCGWEHMTDHAGLRKQCHECAGDGLFIELPVELSVPYRNFTITGITQPKCDTCGADLPTRFEGGAMIIDAHDCKPRGGFEFL